MEVNKKAKATKILNSFKSDGMAFYKNGRIVEVDNLTIRLEGKTDFFEPDFSLIKFYKKNNPRKFYKPKKQ